MDHVAAKSAGSGHSSPDLGEFRRRYPLTVENFAPLEGRERWLRRIWEMDALWRETLARNRDRTPEVILNCAPPPGIEVEAEFDVIYAGGVLGLLHGAVMAARYRRRVMVFDAGAVGRTQRDWNISDDEMSEFERAGLFTREEVETAVVNRYRAGFVKFHDATSRVKTPPLWMDGVLNVALSAEKLLDLAAAKARAAEPGAVLLDGLDFKRAYVRLDRVLVELEEPQTRQRRLFAAKLFVDATGAGSPVSLQLNGGPRITHVCPTVGTRARGFLRGIAPDQVDFNVGEILVSNEDASDHRQLVWEGFAGSPSRDEYSTYLFFYDAVDSPADKSLLSLFERYFENLSAYKRRGRAWRITQPVFGFVPCFNHKGLATNIRTATDRIMVIGDAAGLASPLTFCGFGSHIRHLRRQSHLTELALAADLLDGASLAEINANEPRVAEMTRLAEFLRPTPRSPPAAVNETLNAVMGALHSLDERVRRELFQDRMSFHGFRNLLSRTARLYPRIFQRVREHLGARGTFWWLANIAEAVLHERREARRCDGMADGSTAKADAESEFRRYTRLYRNHGRSDDGR